MTARGLMCVAPLNILRHRPRVALTPLGRGWRCEDCGTARASLLEFDGDEGYVDPERRRFERDVRYQRRTA